jgi:hypothetical protein
MVAACSNLYDTRTRRFGVKLDWLRDRYILLMPNTKLSRSIGAKGKNSFHFGLAIWERSMCVKTDQRLSNAFNDATALMIKQASNSSIELDGINGEGG